MILCRKLVVSGLTVSAGDVEILRRVSFPVWAGSTLAVIGPNGAGKTTLFNAICGEARITRGDICLEGQTLRGVTPSQVANRGIGRLFQDVRVFRGLTIEENISAGVAAALRTSRKEALISSSLKETVDFWINEFELFSFRGQRAGDLSLGQQKQVALARAFAGGFDFLLLDEPAAGLDPRVRSRFLHRLRDLIDSYRVTALVIEHNLEAVRALADWTLGLNQGEVEFIGRTDHMLGDPSVREWLLGLWDQ